MAVGARRYPAPVNDPGGLVCAVGGIDGVALAYGLGALVATFAEVRASYSSVTIALALLSSTVIGLGFGFMPARSAVRLNPVDALARE